LEGRFALRATKACFRKRVMQNAPCTEGAGRALGKTLVERVDHRW
jgi:hypothetical protein